MGCSSVAGFPLEIWFRPINALYPSSTNHEKHAMACGESFVRACNLAFLMPLFALFRSQTVSKNRSDAIDIALHGSSFFTSAWSYVSEIELLLN